MALAQKFVACDSPGNTNLMDYAVNGEQVFQEAQFFRATERAFYDRGNQKTIVTFQVSRVWPDRLTAESYVYFYNTLFPRIGLVSFDSIVGSAGKSSYLIIAAIHPANSKLMGCTTHHQHRIEGGIMSNTPT